MENKTIIAIDTFQDINVKIPLAIKLVNGGDRLIFTKIHFLAHRILKKQNVWLHKSTNYHNCFNFF